MKILFICHGNICRSPMAEYLFRHLAETRGLGAKFSVDSAATSTEEIGNPVHHGTRKILKAHGISTDGKYAVQLKTSDYQKYDYLIGMEQRNVTNMMKILKYDPQGKVHRFLDFTDNPRDIADPWYSGDFQRTYEDVWEGCQALLNHILENNGI